MPPGIFGSGGHMSKTPNCPYSLGPQLSRDMNAKLILLCNKEGLPVLFNMQPAGEDEQTKRST
jgi:hypothetical protein